MAKFHSEIRKEWRGSWSQPPGNKHGGWMTAVLEEVGVCHDLGILCEKCAVSVSLEF